MNGTDFEYLSRESVAHLRPMERTAYAMARKPFIKWMKEQGKVPDRNIGLSADSVENYAHRLHQIYTWVWELHDRFVSVIQEPDANQVIQALDEDRIVKQNGYPFSESSKRKMVDVLKKLFEYKHHMQGNPQWQPPLEFSDNPPENPSDPFTKHERRVLYDASLAYKAPPSYESVTPEERDRWKAKLAQDLGKPKDEVRPDDFRSRRHDWKAPSLIATTLDGALRPVEVKRMNVSWVHLDIGQIKIPRELAAKNRRNWTVPLSDRSVMALDEWLRQRETKETYDESDALWLNRKGNRYESGPLNTILRNLMDQAGIEPGDRKLTWYSFRKSTAQYVHEESDDLTTAAILRSNPENVGNYATPTPEELRRILKSIDG